MSSGGKRPLSGRPVGARNRRALGGEAFARSIVEDPAVQERLRQEAIDGSIQLGLLETLMHYAWGKPYQGRAPDDQRFLESLIKVVLAHAPTPEAKQAIRAVIEQHAGGALLRVVA